MKFGNYLKENILNPWKIEYIQYDLLKMDLKTRQLDHKWNNQDELDFIQLFTNEKNKLTQFITCFHQQLISRIQYSRHLLESCTASQNTKPSIEFLNNLDDTLIEIIFDIHDFTKFIQLNKLGFSKILKKHQKWTNIDHTHLSCYEYQTIDSSLDSNWCKSLYTKVSLIRYQCQNYSQSYPTPTKKPITERRIKKYWILPQHVSEIVAILCIQSHIIQPIKFKNKDFDFSLSNIYFDNSNMDIYNHRLLTIDDEKKLQTMKCKRYGSNLNDCICIENEIYSSFNSSDISNKYRLKIEYSKLKDFFSDPNKSEFFYKSSSKENYQSKETSKFIQDLHLKPKIQCDYNRLSFQNHLNHEIDVHITIDTDIRFYKINNEKSQSFFTNKNDGIAFPYAVLEIKLPSDTSLDDPSLYWLNTFILKNDLLKEIPKFTKYLQGTFQLDTSANLSSPPWFEIYKRGINESTLPEGLSRSKSLRPLLNGKPYRNIVPYYLGNNLNEPTYKSQQTTYRKSQHNNNHISVSMSSLTTDENKSKECLDEKIVTDVSEKLQVMPVRPIYGTKSSYLFPATFFFSNKTDSDSNTILDHDSDSIRNSNDKLSKKKKKVFKLETIKIEPKVFFANERTFISWLQFCALLLTVALNLLNFGDHLSKICGAIFLFISVLLAFYALARFQYRAWQLRTPAQKGRFDDIYGPAVLCILVVAALIINFWIRFTHGEESNNQIYPSRIDYNNTAQE